MSPRRPGATGRRFPDELIRPPLTDLVVIYKEAPEPIRAWRQPQATFMAPPHPAIVGGRPSSPVSGNFSRRHRPGHSGTTRASPSPLSPLGTPSPSRESVPLLNLDRDSPRAKSHFFRRPPTAGELAAGSSVHPRGRINHRSNRLDPLSPRVTSVYRAVLPFPGERRWSPAPPLGQRKRREVD